MYDLFGLRKRLMNYVLFILILFGFYMFNISVLLRSVFDFSDNFFLLIFKILVYGIVLLC